MSKFKKGDKVEIDTDYFCNRFRGGEEYDFSEHSLKPGVQYTVARIQSSFFGEYVVIEGFDDTWDLPCFKPYEKPIDLGSIPTNLSFWQKEVDRLQMEFLKESNPIKQGRLSDSLITANLRLQRELKERELCLNS